MSEVAGNSGNVASQPTQGQQGGSADGNVSTNNSPQQTNSEQFNPSSPEKVTSDSMNDYQPGEQEEQKLVEHKEPAKKQEPKPKKKEKVFGPDNPPSLADILNDDDDEPEEKPETKEPEKPEPEPKSEPETKEKPETKEPEEKPETKEPEKPEPEIKQEAEPKEEQEPKQEPETEPETEPEKPKERHRITERLMKSFPDKEYKSDDEAFDHAIEHLDYLESYQKRNNETNERLYDTLNDNPELLSFVGDVVNGAPVIAALVRNFDLDNISPDIGDPDYDAWDKAKKERAANKKERQATIKMLEENKLASKKEIDKFIKDNKLSEKEADDFLREIDETLKPLTENRIGTDFLTKMRKALTHEKEVEKAAKVAEVKAKNEKIVAERKKKSDVQGDGLPHIQSQGKPLDNSQKSDDDDLFNAIDKITSREEKVYGKRK